MAQIELRLSSKKLTNGKSEILLRFYNGKKFNLRAKSGVYIDPKYFEYEIDWGKTVESGIKMPKKTPRQISTISMIFAPCLASSSPIT